jgi:protoheme IX farnesyltransferase
VSGVSTLDGASLVATDRAVAAPSVSSAGAGLDASADPPGPASRADDVAAASVLADLVALAKPGIVRMCVIMAAGGLWLAPGTLTVATAIATLVGCALTVASANAANMIWERESDAHMERTKSRPLASGRLSVGVATAFSVITGVVGLVILAWGTNLLTAALALFAIASYVLAYTPLKRVSWAALIVGAAPGAIPPLLGWTAVTGRLDLPGVVLFGILFIWQIPHFIAIALWRRDDYARAGIRVAPAQRGATMSKLEASMWCVGLIPVSMALTPLGVTGPFYFIASFVLGAVFFGWSLTGFGAADDAVWGKRFFIVSLLYLPALTVVLFLDALLWR